MKQDNTFRKLINTADSISIDDEFIRYFNFEGDDEFEIIITLEDVKYTFTSKAIDQARYYDNESWSIYCDTKKQYVDVSFYNVQNISAKSESAKQDYHPTSGCVTVQAKNEDEAFQKMKDALDAHPDIECDWIDGRLITSES